VRALDSDLIAARPTASEYAYLPGAQWSDSLPKLLQMRLLQTFQNSGRVAAVGLPGQGLLIDYQVILDIRAFELTGQTAVTEFAVKLMNDRNGRIVKTTVVRAEVPTVSEGTEAVVAALDAGMDDAFLQIVDWVAAGR
jgi:cholesterol transport system auxiliary component